MVKSTKFLGIHIDQHLDWSEQISTVCRRVNTASYSLRILSKYLDLNTIRVVYFANIQSVLRFGVIFWGASTDAQRVFIAQKRAVRILGSMRYRDSCRSRFRELNILTFTGLYIYECLKFLFKNRNLYSGLEIGHQFNTRNLGLNVPMHRLTATERGPAYASVKFFNKLPNNLKAETNFRTFKNSLLNLLIRMEPYSVAEFLNYDF